MKKSDITKPPCYFDRYIDLVSDIELVQSFNESMDELDGLDLVSLSRLNQVVYADGKGVWQR